MTTIQHELQNIIFGNEQISAAGPLKEARCSLSGYAQANFPVQEQQPIENK